MEDFIQKTKRQSTYCMYAHLLQSGHTLCDRMDCSPPGSSVHGIFWSGLPFPTPGDLPNPGNELEASAWQGGGWWWFLPLCHLGSRHKSPDEALAELLVWPLVNFCWLGKTKNRVQYQSHSHRNLQWTIVRHIETDECDINWSRLQSSEQ